MRDKQQSNSGAAPTTVSEELLRCSYVIFGGVSATVGTHGLIRRRAAVMHRGVHLCLPGVSSLRVCVSSVSFSGCSSLRPGSLCPSAPSHCCRSVPVLLYHPPSSGDWAALVRFDEDSLSSTRQCAPTPHEPKRARAWPTMWARVRLYGFMYMCACVRECAQAQMCQWVRLGLKEWVIQQQERSQLLPAPAQLTAAAAMRW